MKYEMESEESTVETYTRHDLPSFRYPFAWVIHGVSVIGIDKATRIETMCALIVDGKVFTLISQDELCAKE